MLQRRQLNQMCPKIKVNGEAYLKTGTKEQTSFLEDITVTASQANNQQKQVENQLANQKKNTSVRMKLKDYLFLAQTSASKSAVQKRKILQSKSNRRNRDNNQNNLKDSDISVKKNKYGMKNSEMFQILKDEIFSQLQQNIREIANFKEELMLKNGDRLIPSSQQMMTMYKIRALLKQKMRECLKDMKQIVQTCNPKKQGIQFEIQLDEQQLRTDISFTQQKFSRKYIELQVNQKNV